MNPNKNPNQNKWNVFHPATTTSMFAGGTRGDSKQQPTLPFGGAYGTSGVMTTGNSLLETSRFTDLSHKQSETVQDLKLLKFMTTKEQLKDKITGVFMLSYMLSTDEVPTAAETLSKNSCIESFNLKTLGLHALLKMDELNLRQKLRSLLQEEQDITFTLINLLYALLEESIETPDELYKLALQLSSCNKTLTYAIRLIQEQHKVGYIQPDFFGDQPSHLECLVMALFIFAQFNNEPVNAIEEVLKFDREVLRFIIWMLGASCGYKWIKSEWVKFTPSLEPLINKFMKIND